MSLDLRETALRPSSTVRFPASRTRHRRQPRRVAATIWRRRPGQLGEDLPGLLPKQTPWGRQLPDSRANGRTDARPARRSAGRAKDDQASRAPWMLSVLAPAEAISSGRTSSSRRLRNSRRE
jgi:hypothetical protein